MRAVLVISRERGGRRKLRGISNFTFNDTIGRLSQQLISIMAENKLEIIKIRKAPYKNVRLRGGAA